MDVTAIIGSNLSSSYTSSVVRNATFSNGAGVVQIWVVVVSGLIALTFVLKTFTIGSKMMQNDIVA